MTSKKSIQLDYQDNPELRDLFARKETGDKCTLIVELQLDRRDANGMEGTILEIRPSEDYSKEGESEESEDTSSDEKSSSGKKKRGMDPVLMIVDQGTKENAPSLETMRKEAYGG